MKQIKNLLLVMVLLFACIGATAQFTQDTLRNGVVVRSDDRLQFLLLKKAEINKKAAEARRITRGFRIQVLNTTDRSEALAAKSQLLSLYPEHKSYLMYKAPYFKLQIGNFVEKRDADDLKKELNQLFPKGVFVIPSEIESKPEKEKEETARQ